MNTRIWGIIGGFALVLALLSPYLLGSSKKVEQLFEAAEMLYEHNDYKGAIAKYEEALKESNKLRAKTEAIDKDFKTLVNFKIATSYVKLAEQSNETNSYYEKALEHIEKAAQTVELAEYEEELTYLWGQILYKTGKLEQASEKFTALIENFPNSHFVEEAQEIIAHIKQQKREDVVQQSDSVPVWVNDLSKFEAFNKKRNRTLVVPNRLRSEKQYVKAAEQYEAFVNTNPSTIEAAYALYWSGWCYYEAAPHDITIHNKSRAVLQILIDNHSDSPYAFKASEKLDEIIKEKAKCDSDKAIIAAEEAVYRAQQSDCKSDAIPKAITHLGNAKREQEQGNYATALTSANEAQTIAHNTIDNHETAKRYVNQGDTYLNQGKLGTATKKARDALRIDPRYQNAKKLLDKIKQMHFDRGVNYIKAEEYAKAILSLKKAIDIVPFKEAYCHLGRAYLKLGEFKKAITAAKTALAIDPNYKCAHDIIDSIDIGEN